MKKIDSLMMGVRIRNQRELLGMTRDQLSEKIGKTSKFLMDIENGARGCSIQTLAKLSEHLFLSADYILFGGKANNREMFEEYLAHAIRRCPDDCVEELESIIAAYISAVNKRHKD